jgi:hypothetical protein
MSPNPNNKDLKQWKQEDAEYEVEDKVSRQKEKEERKRKEKQLRKEQDRRQ